MHIREFTLDDQTAFARLSGDNNPLHTDAMAARRTLFGSPVIHGVHGVLRALDCWLETQDVRVEFDSIRAMFYKPVKVGDELHLDIIPEDNDTLHIRLLNGSSTATKITAKWSVANFDNNGSSLQVDSPSMSEPRVLSDDEITNDSGSIDLSFNLNFARALLPNLVQRMSLSQIATILHLSRLVGVMCPGLHSLFSEFELTKTSRREIGGMLYKVERFDKRIGLATIKISAPDMIGIVKAFRRPEPKVQASYLTLRGHARCGEFSNQQALVIGGSRGLGEVVAKLLAGGGANVKLTYHKGKDDAEKIVQDIVSNGGTASCFQYDVLNPSISEREVSSTGWNPTHIYYFATPLIFSGAKRHFSPELFREFCDYYVVGFANLLNLLIPYAVKKVYYPSSVFVDELPKNMGEYACAKIASELLCTFLEKFHPDLVIYKSRLPRVATDQTVSIMPVKNEDPVDIMISELRAFLLE